jgi:hypothetical protein
MRTDDDQFADLRDIRDPLAALQAVQDYSHLLGGDPYYRPAVDAVLQMVDRVLKEAETGRRS